MSTLIIYASKYGATKTCAELLAEQLDGRPDIIDLNHGQPNLSKYDTVIIGGSVYAGKIRKPVTAFINANLAELKKKRLGLFVCGIAEKLEAIKEIEENYPEELRNTALAVDSFGGLFDFEKMNFFERAIIKKVNERESFTPGLQKERIVLFAQKMNEA